VIIMDALSPRTALTRRHVLQSLGALIVIAPAYTADYVFARESTVSAGAVKPPLTPTELDSWLAIGRDGRVTAFFGKPDVGQGVDTAISQIVAEELDVPLEHVDMVMADTALTCNQGGVSGSTGVSRGGITLRNAAAVEGAGGRGLSHRRCGQACRLRRTGGRLL
jgi:nicotinate dehydrogenase subunit B